MKVIEFLISKLNEAGSYNAQDQVKPACIIWPDPDLEWKHAVERLRILTKNVLTYGSYNKETKSGPAIWIRYALAASTGLLESDGKIPILYLPGVRIKHLAPSSKYDKKLEFIIELQYRSKVWKNRNTEWHLEDFLKDTLGIDIKSDDLTREALKRSFPYLLDLEVNVLRDRLIDDKFLDQLLCGDIIAELLSWIDNPQKLKENLNEANWVAFSNRAKSEYSIDITSETQLTAAEMLAKHEDAWLEVWKAYSESPDKYPHIIDILRMLPLPSFEAPISMSSIEGWPKWNDDMEISLRNELRDLKGKTPEEAKSTLEKLYSEHSIRAGLPWKNVVSSNCLKALIAINRSIEFMRDFNINGNLKSLTEGYANKGYKIDSSMIEAMKFATGIDREAVAIAIRSVYLPWLGMVCEQYQRKMYLEGSNRDDPPQFDGGPDGCVIFVDGLRFDIAKKVSEKLRDKGLIVNESIYTSPLPTLTSNCKPAISPIAHLFKGVDGSIDFEPQPFIEGQLISKRFSELLESNGWKYCRHSSGIPKKQDRPLWVEYDDIDIEGHSKGSKVAERVESHISEICSTVIGLLESGWSKVQIVTDHGWLLMIDGLEKAVLMKSLTENRYGRCATIKGEVDKSDMLIVPWYWNKDVDVALARGAGCFIANVEYSHGGASLQESQLLRLTVKASDSLSLFNVGIESIEWKGMRAQIRLNKEASGGKYADIRLRPGDPKTSITKDKKPELVDEFNGVKILVDNDDYIGKKAYIVILDSNQMNVILQKETIVGDAL